MKKILMFCHNFPPIGTVSSQRPAKFAKYLREKGWEPAIVSRAHGPEYPVDTSMLQDIPPDVRVYRLRFFPVVVMLISMFRAIRLDFVGRLISRWISIPDYRFSWLVVAFIAALRLVPKLRPDVLWVSAVPTTASILVILLKRFFRLPVVVDFHNEWTRYMYYEPPTRIHDALNRWLERKVLQHADLVVTLNPWQRTDYEERYGIGRKVVVIENGYDPEDFALSEPPKRDRFVLTYVGTVYGFQSIAPVLEGLERLVRAGKIPAERLCVRVVGDMFNNVSRDNPRSYPLEVIRHVPHAQLMTFYQESSAFFLCLSDGAARQLPAKLYEYLYARRPTLAVVPEHSVAREWVQRWGAGMVVTADTVDDGLMRLYQDWERGTLRCEPHPDALHRFTRRALSEELGDALDALVTLRVTRRVSIRKYPYPYRAALSVATDACHMVASRFDEVKSFAAGLGLPISGSFLCYSLEPATVEFAALRGSNGSETEEALKRLKDGSIDTLHSYGNFNGRGGFTRALAVDAVERLAREGIRVRVWTNHGDRFNTQNLLHDSAGGDVPGSSSYHADLLARLGVRFVWNYELTHVPGQDRSLSRTEYYRTARGKKALWRIPLIPAAIAADILPEFEVVTNQISRRANVQPYCGNDLVRRQQLRDGQWVYVFRRYGDWKVDRLNDLSKLLNPAALSRLREKGGCSIIYTHFGKGEFGSPAADAFRRLKCAEASGHVWVPQASKLLEYVSMRRTLRWSVEVRGRQLKIRIGSPRCSVLGERLPAPEELSDLTFYVPDGFVIEVQVGDISVAVRENPPDHSGKRSVTLTGERSRGA